MSAIFTLVQNPMDKHSIDDNRLLLGMAGWPLLDGRQGYFPDDLPRDWQFAYYSNDADCLMLSASQWRDIGIQELASWLDDVEEHFRFYLEWPNGTQAVQGLELLGDHLGGLLVDDFQEIDSRWPQFRQEDGGYWSDANGRPKIWVWSSLPADLRVQRERLERLPSGLEALLIADGRAVPGDLGNLRRLIELLGIA